MKHLEKLFTNNVSHEEFVHNDKGIQQFCKTWIDTANNFASLKRKEIKCHFTTKEPLSSETIFLKSRAEEYRLLYTKQRNKCVSFKKC